MNVTMHKFALLACLALGACSLVLPVSDHQGGEFAEDASLDVPEVDTATDVPDDCPSNFECAQDVPGWIGPVIVVSGPGADSAPACPTATRSEFIAKSGLVTPAAECSCSCEAPDPTGESCGPITVIVSTSGDCTTGRMLRETYESDGQCESVGSLTVPGGWTVTESSYRPRSGSVCTPISSTNVEPAAWSLSHQACGFDEPTTCSLGTCAPERTEGERLCVYVDRDEAECPAPFSDRISTAEDVNDDRSCLECTCGRVTGQCSGSVSLVNGCDGTNSVLLEGGRCQEGLPGLVRSHGISEIEVMRSSVGCPAAEGSNEPQGTATPTRVRTVCCLPSSL